MNRTPMWWGMIIGFVVGGMIPSLWNAGMFSLSGVFLTAFGGIAGIWVGWNLR